MENTSNASFIEEATGGGEETKSSAHSNSHSGSKHVSLPPAPGATGTIASQATKTVRTVKTVNTVKTVVTKTVGHGSHESSWSTSGKESSKKPSAGEWSAVSALNVTQLPILCTLSFVFLQGKQFSSDAGSLAPSSSASSSDFGPGKVAAYETIEVSAKYPQQGNTKHSITEMCLKPWLVVLPQAYSYFQTADIEVAGCLQHRHLIRLLTDVENPPKGEHFLTFTVSCKA
jgi:hypothetical protein